MIGLKYVASIKIRLVELTSGIWTITDLRITLNGLRINLTLWTQTLLSSLKCNYVYVLLSSSFLSIVTVRYVYLYHLCLWYRTIDAHSVVVLSICILIWFGILWNSVTSLLFYYLLKACSWHETVRQVLHAFQWNWHCVRWKKKKQTLL